MFNPLNFAHRVVRRILPTRVYGAGRVLLNPKLYAPLNFVTYNQDRLVTQHNCDFMQNELFQKAYLAGEATNSWKGQPIHWRLHILFWAAERARQMEGDFIECGVNRGGFSRAVIEYLDFTTLSPRKFYLLDTFNGLVEKFLTEEEKDNVRNEFVHFEECFDEVQKCFAGFENVILVRGVIPDTLPQVKTERVCFISIDMNCVEPEIAAAEYFWDKMVSGAAMVLDDYGWTEFINQKRAFDEFAKRKNVPILALPTGQGLILKP